MVTKAPEFQEGGTWPKNVNSSRLGFFICVLTLVLTKLKLFFLINYLDILLKLCESFKRFIYSNSSLLNINKMAKLRLSRKENSQVDFLPGTQKWTSTFLKAKI